MPGKSQTQVKAAWLMRGTMDRRLMYGWSGNTPRFYQNQGYLYQQNYRTRSPLSNSIGSPTERTTVATSMSSSVRPSVEPSSYHRSGQPEDM